MPVRQLVSIARQAKASGLSDHTEVDNPSTVSDSCLAKMDQYLHLVLEQNKVMNLTGKALRRHLRCSNAKLLHPRLRHGSAGFSHPFVQLCGT